MTLELNHLKHYLGTGLKCQYIGIIDVLKYNRCSFSDPFDSEEETGMGLKVGELKEIKIYKKYWKAYVGTFHGHLKSFINGYDLKLCLIPLSALTEPEYEKVFDEFSEMEYSDLLDRIDYVKMGLQNSENICNNLRFEVINALFANHFDVYGLIEHGLAIDKRTLK